MYGPRGNLPSRDENEWTIGLPQSKSLAINPLDLGFVWRAPWTVYNIVVVVFICSNPFRVCADVPSICSAFIHLCAGVSVYVDDLPLYAIEHTLGFAPKICEKGILNEKHTINTTHRRARRADFRRYNIFVSFIVSHDACVYSSINYISVFAHTKKKNCSCVFCFFEFVFLWKIARILCANLFGLWWSRFLTVESPTNECVMHSITPLRFNFLLKK